MGQTACEILHNEIITMNLIKKITLTAFAFFLISGCGNKDFDRSLILENITNNLIIPTYEDFNQRTQSLREKAEAFTGNPTAESLADLKTAWELSIKSWKHAEVYNFGPVESMLLVTAIDRWPTSEPGIEQAIEEYDGSDDYLVRLGSNRKGLPAIEYLLFHDESSVIIDEFSDPTRKTYLNLLAEALTEHSAAILEAWTSGFGEEFISKIGNKADSGITLLANELGYIHQKVRMEKLEIPFGSQTEGTPRLQMLESIHAYISKELIRENLISARRTFNGGDGNGFDDYLNALGIKDENGELLSEAVNNEYENAFRILDRIDGTLKDAIQNDKSTIQELIDSIQKLYIYTDLDMISQLGILTVFSDNDGD